VVQVCGPNSVLEKNVEKWGQGKKGAGGSRGGQSREVEGLQQFSLRTEISAWNASNNKFPRGQRRGVGRPHKKRGNTTVKIYLEGTKVL